MWFCHEIFFYSISFVLCQSLQKARITTRSAGKRVMDLADTFTMMVLHITLHPTLFRLYIDGTLPPLDVPTMSLKKAGRHQFQLSANEILTGVRIYEPVWML